MYLCCLIIYVPLIKKLPVCLLLPILPFFPFDDGRRRHIHGIIMGGGTQLAATAFGLQHQHSNKEEKTKYRHYSAKRERERERERERLYLEYDRHSLCLKTVGRGGGGGRQTERQTELQSGRENPSLSDCNDFIVLRRLKLSWNVPGIEYPCFFTTHDLTDISSK
jgi:hypothetical protein